MIWDSYFRNNENKEIVFNEYLKVGGFPYIATADKTNEKINMYLEGIYNTIILKDIEERQRRREFDPTKRKVTDIALLKKMINYALDTKFNNMYDIDLFWIFWESNIITKADFIAIQSFGKIRNDITNAHAIHNCDDEVISNDIDSLINYINLIRKIDVKTSLKSTLYFANRKTANKSE